MSRERTRTQEPRGPRARSTQRSGNGDSALADALGMRQERESLGSLPAAASGTTRTDVSPTSAEPSDSGVAVATMEMPETALSPEEQAHREAEIAAAVDALTSAESAGAALNAFADAPPSVKARAQGTLGQTIGVAEETATTSFQESLPAFPVRMGGEPLVETMPPVTAPAPVPATLESGTPPPPQAPDIDAADAMGAYDGNASVASGVDRALSTQGATPEAVASALGSVRTTDPGITTSPGASPRVPLTPGSQTDPGRMDAQHQEARNLAGGARNEAVQAVIDGPGPEQARLREMDEERQLGRQPRPQVDEIAAAEGAEAFVALQLPEDVTAQFDADTHAEMQAGVAESRRTVADAETRRDLDRRAQLDAAEAERQALETDADRQQRARVQEAREEIQTERRNTLQAQEQAVADLERDAEAERTKQRDEIQSRVQADEQTVDDAYLEAERDAQREVASGEQKAEKEKASAEAKAESESWWDRATSFVKQAFARLTSVINDIFDKVRATVHAVLDKARELAKKLIDAAAAFIKDAIAAFGELLKGLVNALLADVFPGLARALTDAIDGAVATVNKAVDAIAEKLKQGVDAIVDLVQAGMDAILDAYQGALNFALGALQAALTGDWAAVFERILEAVLRLVGIDPQEFYAMIARARDSLRSIIENPGGFLTNLIDAVVLGFRNFAGNFLEHLKAGIIGWLTGALGDIQLPEKWDIWGVLDIIRQVLGLTWDWLKERAARLIGEKNVERLEHLFGYIATLVTEGWSGLFQRVKDELSDLKDLVLSQIKEFLLVKVVQAGITWLAGLFSPVGALVKIVVTIWNLYTFLRDQLARMFEIVRSVVDSLDRIVRGVLDAAAQKIESVLANLLPVAIDLIAKLVGVTGVAARVREVIGKVRARITDAVDRLLDCVARLFKPGAEERRSEDQKSTAPGTGEIEVGEVLRVATPGHPDHTLSIDVRGNDATVVLRSDPAPVARWLTDFRQRMPEIASEHRRATAQAALDEATNALARLDPQADAFVERARTASPANRSGRVELPDDADVDATQRTLRDALVTLFATFDVPKVQGFEERIAAAHPLVRQDLARALAAGAQEIHGRDWEDIRARLLTESPFDKPMLRSHGFGAAVQETVRVRLEAIAAQEQQKHPSERRPVPVGNDVESFLSNNLARRVNAGEGDYRRARADLQQAMLVEREPATLPSLDAAIETALNGLQSDDGPDRSLVAAVGGGKIDQFLMAVARGDASFPGLELPEGLTLDQAWNDVYWGTRNNPNREWLKDRFRKGGGQHEWLPTNYIGDVIEQARQANDGDRAENAARWIVFQTTFRSDTKILFFSPDGPYSRTVTGLRDPQPPHAPREDPAGTGTYKVLQGHVGAAYAPVGDGGYVDNVQAQTVGQNPWHDGLRDIFNRHKAAATTLTGITAIMGDTAAYADETLWSGEKHTGWGFEEYYDSSRSAADGKTIDPGALRSRAKSARDEIAATIERTRRAVLEVKLP